MRSGRWPRLPSSTSTNRRRGRYRNRNRDRDRDLLRHRQPATSPLFFQGGEYIILPSGQYVSLLRELLVMDTYTPCLACGACCACFRVSFYWTESDLATPDGVPHELTEHLQGHYLAMQGTDRCAPRCIALSGTIGAEVRCAIYLRRPSACRNFIPSWQDKSSNDRCDTARVKCGLAPLDPTSWSQPGGKEIQRVA